MITPQQALNSGFGIKTPSDEILDGLDLGDKVAVVTGGYSGIGLATVEALSKRGVDVYVPARNMDKANVALSGFGDNVTCGEMDLADISSVKSFAENVRSHTTRLDMLINNAGIMACPEQSVGPGWEAQFGVCHMGHFALTKELTPLLQKTDGARVVSLSSIAHKRNGILWDDMFFKESNYEKWTAYAQAKSANSLFAIGQDAKFKGDDIRAFAVHPGGILTPLQRHLEKEEMIAMGWIDETGEVAEAAKPLFKNPDQGAGTSLWCATSPMLDGMGGVYCENADIANMATADEMGRYFGVMPHAIDAEEADRLWDLSEKLLANAC